jgi:hypothetical protein
MSRSLRATLRRVRRRGSAAAVLIRKRLLTIDPRTLGLYRIALGGLLCMNLIDHWVEARTYYSNEGVLTNHFNLFRPPSSYNFTLAFACHLGLMIGWRTRLFSVLSFLWATSLDGRLVLVENGGYVVVNLMALWGMFLPLGQRFSVDSLRRSLRECGEYHVTALAERYRPLWLQAPRVSLAAGLLLVNFGFIYLFNVVNKYGSVWRSGATTHYVLHIDRMITGVAVPLREHLPVWSLRLSSWLVLLVEAWIVMLIFWPRGRRYSRPLAMLLIAGLHTAFGVLMRLGPFSWFMIGWSTVLLLPMHWRWLGKRAARRRTPLTLGLHPGSAWALAIGRLLSRLDRLELLSFEARDDDTHGVVALEHGETMHGARAVAAVARRLPGGRPCWALLQLATLGGAGWLLARLDRHHQRVGAWLGLPLPRQSDSTAWSGTPASSAVRLRLRASVRALRELALLYLAACAVSQALNENKSIPKLFKHRQPEWVRATILYPRIFQGWGMFAPGPIRHDGIVAVDARTIDGRRIDPFTGREPDLNLSDARGLGLSQIRQDYFNRIRLDGNKAYRQPLDGYLRRWHEFGGRAEDGLVSFDVYWLRDRCPDIGKLRPTDHQKIAILSWRKPGYRPPAGAAPLPPRPKIESADK